MAEPRKRCFYEVLCVSRDASQEEIRSAYKRLALQLHPDKVAASAAAASSAAADDAAAAATAAFQELRHAYEVLSDPKERAYYDSHRSQILFSDAAAAKSHKASSFADLDLFSFFSNSAFSGFSDTGRGFYNVYGDLFAKVYAKELWFATTFGSGPGAVPPAPLIGNLDSPYEQVTAFYNYWLGFCTVMDFAWVDEYDAMAGPNRRSRRAMEEENKKLRKKAKREYNDSVRGLAAFVKKRDKRVVDMMRKTKMEEEKRRAAEKERKREEERKKMERARAYEEPEWSRINEKEDVIGFDDDGEDDDEKSKKKKKGGEEFYCVACNKKFKSDKQWKNHEQSKKHRDKVAELKTMFKEEEEVFDEEERDGDEVFADFDYEPAPESEDGEAVDELCADVQDDLKLHEESVEDEDMEGGDDKSLDTDNEASILESMVSGRKARKSDSLNHQDSAFSSIGHHEIDGENSMANDDTRSRGRRNRASRRQSNYDGYDEAVRTQKDGSQQDESGHHNRERGADDNKEGSCLVEEVVTQKKGDRAAKKNQKPKENQVDGKGAGKTERAGDQNHSSKARKQKAKDAPSNSCGTCGESFESRNKLFAHLGNTGHAMLKSR
uniref:DNAJ protein JJJ1 homolog n=1 Tax=Ananas comosus var. bracteatus TaxID=296719 RepID=A0A6V7Q4H2_ANACO|nr:unnamed protein product [Ananas comosus var. bracteatus]